MTYKCNICGGQNAVKTGNGMAVCVYCGATQQIAPHTDTADTPHTNIADTKQKKNRLILFVIVIFLLAAGMATALAICVGRARPVQVEPTTTMQESQYETYDPPLSEENVPAVITTQAAVTEAQTATMQTTVAPTSVNASFGEVPYLFKIRTDGNLIYTEPAYSSSVVRIIEKGTFTIVAEQTDEYGRVWGKLKSGLGWICLSDIQKYS